MPNIKPVKLKTGHVAKEEIKKREDMEEKLKGNTEISIKAPIELSKNGKKIYKEVISLLPKGFLNGGDRYTVGIVAEALDRMQTCQIKINTEGLFAVTETGEIENQAIKTYERYSKIFEKFAAKLGLSPKDRASLSVLLLQDKDEEEDPVLRALRGEDV